MTNANEQIGVGTVFVTAIVFFIIGFVLTVVLMALPYGECQYRQGQIDALSGHAGIELRDQPNGERVWVTKATTQRSN